MLTSQFLIYKLWNVVFVPCKKASGSYVHLAIFSGTCKAISYCISRYRTVQQVVAQLIFYNIVIELRIWIRLIRN
jgi:hypothetical protein